MKYKKLKNEYKKFDLITNTFFIILILTLVCNYLFSGGDKIYRIFLTIGVVLIARIIFGKIFLKKSEFTYYCVLMFVFTSMYVGNILNIYIIIPFYDKILHLISGIIIGFIGFIIFAYFTKRERQSIKKSFAILFIMSFSIALAGVWEIWEFSTDFLFGLNSQNGSLIDTMLDIICGTIGGIISLIPVISYLKNRKNSFIELMLKDIN